MIVFERRNFDSAAAAALAEVLGDDLPAIARECLDGTSELFHLRGYGWLVTRTEVRPGGDELVIVAAAGKGTAEVLPVLQQIARKNNCATMRAHSRRPGMARLLKRYGFTERERVYGWRVE